MMNEMSIDLALLTIRTMNAFDGYLQQRQQEVANGNKEVGRAADEIAHYGQGLADALALAEELAGRPSAGMADHIIRRVQQFRMCHLGYK